VQDRYRRCIQKFPDWVIQIINTYWEATQGIIAAKVTRLTHRIAIQLHLVAESCTICSSRSRWPVRKLLDTPLYVSLLTLNSTCLYINIALSATDVSADRGKDHVLVTFTLLNQSQEAAGASSWHSPPSSAEVKNAWNYTFTPHTSSWNGAQRKLYKLYIKLHFTEHRTNNPFPANCGTDLVVSQLKWLVFCKRQNSNLKELPVPTPIPFLSIFSFSIKPQNGFSFKFWYRCRQCRDMGRLYSRTHSATVSVITEFWEL
jgi:hypothetical protein